MDNKSASPAKPFVYAFTSGQLVLLVCLVLGLMVLSLMLGIRIEGYQRGSGGLPQEAARQLPIPQSLPVQPSDVSQVVEETEEVEEPVAAQEPEATAPVPPAPSTAPPTPTKTVQQTQTSAPPVKPAVISPKPEPKPVAPAPKPQPVKAQPVATSKESPKIRFVVQVSSSQDKSLAVSQADLLKKKGFAAFIEEADMGAKGRFYRLMVGPFSTEAEAQRVRGQLVKDPMFANSYVRQLP